MFYFSLAFLIVSLIVTVLLFLYVEKLEEETASLESTISQIDDSITELTGDPNIQIFKTYEKNKGLLEKLTYESRVSSFVNHMKKNFIKYGVSWKWFSYANGKAWVSMSAETNDNGYAYEKVVNFIRWYEADEKALFDLSTISIFTWYDEIKFAGEYKLK